VIRFEPVFDPSTILGFEPTADPRTRPWVASFLRGFPQCFAWNPVRTLDPLARSGQVGVSSGGRVSESYGHTAELG
jgi:hypothetical protein